MPHLYQMRQKAGRRDGGLGGQQAVEQLAHPQDARTQLAQPKHQVHGNSVVFKVRVNGGSGGTAGFQALAQSPGCLLQPVGGAQRMQHFHAQAFHVADQRMKGLCVAGRFAHAQAQPRRKAGRENLPRAVGDGVQQCVLPARCALRALRRQQGYQPVQRGFVQCAEPLCIESTGQGQNEELRCVNGFGAVRQQLVAQSLCGFAEQCRVLGKAKISQQRGDVYRLHQGGPPGLQLPLHIGARLDRFQKQLDPGRGTRYRIARATHPVEQVNQPYMALPKSCVWVQGRKQARQILGRPLQCSTLPFMG